MPPTIAGSSAEAAVAVDLLEAVEDARDDVEGVRPLDVSRPLHCIPRRGPVPSWLRRGDEVRVLRAVGRSIPARRARPRCGRACPLLKAPAHVLRRGAERGEEERDPVAQLRARHDLVEEALLEKELALAEAHRQLLADGAARHALAGEPDERARFGEVEVAERRVRREEPPVVGR